MTLCTVSMQNVIELFLRHPKTPGTSGIAVTFNQKGAIKI
jgi:hypothetical protein